MKEQTLYQLFLDELEDMYHSEHVITTALPKLIDSAFLETLQEDLSHHFEETKEQIKRLERIFSFLEHSPKKKRCRPMEEIVKKAEELISNQTPSATLDAAIISSAQKVEHYEIACYGTLRSLAKALECDDEIIDLLKETLNEEESADKKLIKAAEGTLFSQGVNRKAMKENTVGVGKRGK